MAYIEDINFVLALAVNWKHILTLFQIIFFCFKKKFDDALALSLQCNILFTGVLCIYRMNKDLTG